MAVLAWSAVAAGSSAPPGPTFMKSLKGPLQDAQCDIEAVEAANSQQLSALLADVLGQSFFRKFRVLDDKCPFWENKKKKRSENTAASDAGSDGPAVGGAGSHDVEDEHGGGDDGDEPSCADTSAALGLAEPACSLSGVSDNPFGAAVMGTSSSPLFPTSSSTTNPKHSIPKGPSTDAVEGVVSHVTESSLEKTTGCADPSSQEFWLDMCDGFTNSSNSAKWVDLKENEERWTGYNGSHVWAAIYSENCFSQFGEFSDMCYEERVLYRLLSGMHASVNIHIAQKFFPPSKRLGRTKWMPNPSLFKQHFADHPERLMNVHFAFVVLLRALVKAKPVLYDYEFVNPVEPTDLQNSNENQPRQQDRTSMLMRRLLDSDILDSCSGVFSAFDESLLFSDGTSPSTSEALKSSFKGVFQNVSSLLNCVTCQKCKLHGKVALMGMGTALKILLSPPDLFRSKRAVLTPIEVVALVNSIGKFSSSISAIEELERQSWEEGYFARIQKSKGVSKRAIKSGKAESSGNADAVAASDAGSYKQLLRTFSEFSDTMSAKMDELKHESDQSKRLSVLDKALEVIAKTLNSNDYLSPKEEDALVDRVMEDDAGVMLLLKNFAERPRDLMRHLRRRGLLRKAAASSHGRGAGGAGGATTARGTVADPGTIDAVVVGAGLSGLTAAITLVDRGANVVIVEKNAFSGGNSAYASSGLNAVKQGQVQSLNNASDDSSGNGDSVEAYTLDTLRSSGGSSTASVLAPVLTKGSFEALSWVRERVGLPMMKKSQLGGHRFARTWRPENGMAGSEIIFALNKIVKHLQQSTGRLRIMYRTRMDRVLTAIDSVGSGGNLQERANGVSVVDTKTGKKTIIQARNVIMATGGYAADRTPETSLLAKHRPDLLHFASTNGAFATGDGHKAVASVGVATVEMENVQVHPTAFVDPRRMSQQKSSGGTSIRKTLCAELLRGVGGVLLDRRGRRFANELGKRDYVVAQMKVAAGEIAKEEGSEDIRLAFAIVLNSVSANTADKHVPHYTKKGLLTRVETRADLAEWMQDADGAFRAVRGLNEAKLDMALDEYILSARTGAPDSFGKEDFTNAEAFAQGPFWVGVVTPALHYTMGGISISASGQALREDGSVFPGLYVAGEATGGVHGVNRLGGNALTECVVFGRAVGNAISVGEEEQMVVEEEEWREGIEEEESPEKASSARLNAAASDADATLRAISLKELARHQSVHAGVWTAIDGKVYDMTEFLEEHPAGPESIMDVAGKDGTEVFLGVHTLPMLHDEFKPIGVLVES
jgi:flavocytochrome c